MRFTRLRRDPRDALRARLERAPDDHAEAILAAYDVLQQLHDRGILDIVRSGLAAGDELLDKVVDSADTPEAVRALRNLLFWRQVLGRIEPEWFQGIFQAIPDGLATATAQRDEPDRALEAPAAGDQQGQPSRPRGGHHFPGELRASSPLARRLRTAFGPPLTSG